MGSSKNPATGSRGRVPTIKAVGAAFDTQNPSGITLGYQGAVLVVGTGGSISKRARASENATISITCFALPSRVLIVRGRLAWCLRELLTAGDKGITAYEQPTPHVSDYVRRLRKKYGFEIETERERHGGPYPGIHARYRLKGDVRVAWERQAGQ